jgi:chromosome partitioning protein
MVLIYFTYSDVKTYRCLDVNIYKYNNINTFICRDIGAMIKMKVILILSQKGGSGKSTTAINLAVEFSQKNNTVLLDVDPQGSTVDWGSQRKEQFEKNNIYTSYIPLEKIEETLTALKKNGCEYVIVDTPPIIADAHAKLLKHSDFAVVPLQTTRNDLPTITNTVNLIEQAGVDFGIVISRAEVGTTMYEKGKDVLARYGRVLGTIKSTVKMQYSAYECKGISEYDAKHENSIEFKEITNNIIRILQNKGK